MWQPEQPSSQTVASLTLLIRLTPFCRAASCRHMRSRFTISSTARPFSASAPVGHACTHLPQLVQRRRLAPGLVHVARSPAMDAARHHVPHVRAFHLRADPHAARAQDAAVVVDARSAHAKGPPAAWDSGTRKRTLVTPARAPSPAARSGRWTRTPRRHDCARPAAIRRSCGGSASASASSS